MLLWLLKSSWQNVSACDRVRLVSRCVGADRLSDTLNAHYLFLASALHHHLMIESLLVLRSREQKRENHQQDCGEKSINFDSFTYC